MAAKTAETKRVEFFISSSKQKNITNTKKELNILFSVVFPKIRNNMEYNKLDNNYEYLNKLNPDKRSRMERFYDWEKIIKELYNI